MPPAALRPSQTGWTVAGGPLTLGACSCGWRAPEVEPMRLTDVDMRTGVCPKCGAKEIRRRSGGGVDGCRVPTGLLTSARIDRFACVSCGYLEQYLDQA